MPPPRIFGLEPPLITLDIQFDRPIFPELFQDSRSHTISELLGIFVAGLLLGRMMPSGRQTGGVKAVKQNNRLTVKIYCHALSSRGPTYAHDLYLYILSVMTAI